MTLERMHVDVDTCGDLSAARTVLGSKSFDICLTDMRLPDGDGLELVEWMQLQGITTPVAVITAHGNVETAVKALKLGAFDFISKPVNLEDLRRLVDNALRLGAATAGDARLLGESPAIKQVVQLIAKVARSQAPVHISGESGTGKELVARMIHEQGARQHAPFVPVNCGAIPSELVESEFFGHRKGSFTGAVSDKQGLFQSADGGTLFLDEIADLPLAMQVKLLRVIQEKSVRPIGANEETTVDVRILSATHKDLQQLVRDGEFREDLYYRINVIEVDVPPLRERGNDVLILANAILKRLGGTMGIAVPKLAADAEAALQAHSWPGNVRELENMLERAATLCDGGVISAADLSLRDSAAEIESNNVAEPDLGNTLKIVERDVIIKALEENRHNKTATAKALGLSLRALRYRIQKLGID
jgi:two-component system response regulator PilR (NtrC family)